jgi:hypothetical protein
VSFYGAGLQYSSLPFERLDSSTKTTKEAEDSLLRINSIPRQTQSVFDCKTICFSSVNSEHNQVDYSSHDIHAGRVVVSRRCWTVFTAGATRF